MSDKDSVKYFFNLILLSDFFGEDSSKDKEKFAYTYSTSYKIYPSNSGLDCWLQWTELSLWVEE